MKKPDLTKVLKFERVFTKLGLDPYIDFAEFVGPSQDEDMTVRNKKQDMILNITNKIADAENENKII